MSANPLPDKHDPGLADVAALLRTNMDKLDGIAEALKAVHYAPGLSAAEFRVMEGREPFGDCRLIYERAYTRTVNARDALRLRLHQGVPEMKPLPNGGYSGMDGLHQREVAELVNAYATQSRLLWSAAQMVCDIEELPDDGLAQGIRWGCPL